MLRGSLFLMGGIDHKMDQNTILPIYSLDLLMAVHRDKPDHHPFLYIHHPTTTEGFPDWGGVVKILSSDVDHCVLLCELSFVFLSIYLLTVTKNILTHLKPKSQEK